MYVCKSQIVLGQSKSLPLWTWILHVLRLFMFAGNKVSVWLNIVDKRSRRGEPKSPHAASSPRNDASDVDESSPVIQAFREYQKSLDARHDKYERLVKLSRDITIGSKRTIFLLHRVTGYICECFFLIIDSNLAFVWLHTLSMKVHNLGVHFCTFKA